MSNISPANIRIISFVGVTLVLLCWEKFLPLKKVNHHYYREKSNLFLFIFGIFATRLFVPIGLFYFEQQDKFNFDFINVNSIIVTYLIFDFALYWQHRFTHQFNSLWKLHRVHHYDQDLTLSTGLRFHPLEILLSMAYKIALCMIFKFSPVGILIFEIVLNASSLFTHANIKIPKKARLFIGKFIFTPNLHHIHHSVIPGEQKSNFGFILILWDKLFKTYNSERPVEDIELGVKGIVSPDADSLSFLMKSPFSRQ